MMAMCDRGRRCAWAPSPCVFRPKVEAVAAIVCELDFRSFLFISQSVEGHGLGCPGAVQRSLFPPTVYRYHRSEF